MNTFEKCLRQQLSAHSSMTAQDVVKLCYQAACGAEHLLSDLDAAAALFYEEFEAVPQRNEPLFEQISRDVCRVNLGAWKQSGMPSEWLFRMFTGTVFQSDGKNKLNKYLRASESVLQDAGFDMKAWGAFISAYQNDGMPAVRHSAIYRACEQPAYRIVSTEYLTLLPILRTIANGTAADNLAEQGDGAAAVLLKKVLG